MTFDELLRYIDENRAGFTVDLKTGKPATTGYAVSITNGLDLVAAWQTAEALTTKTGPAVYIGGWTNPKGDIIVDITYVVLSRTLALCLATFFNQDAIYDLAEKKTISCKEA